MDPKYAQWVEMTYPDWRGMIGQCRQASERMKESFPELRVTNGFVFLGATGLQMHWWCVGPDNSVVDPTARQYAGLGTPITSYEEITDEHDARKYPNKKCMNCGEYYYVKPELKGTMHTAKCQQEFTDYLEREWSNQ